MARKVFFSFHFKRDAWRVGQVRNSNVVKQSVEGSPFLDGADWEKVERQGDPAIQRWIDTQLQGTSVTVVLIGNQTAGRKWVNYEIEKSFNEGKGLLGVYIHNIKDSRQVTDSKGSNPFDNFTFKDNRGNSVRLSSVVKTYDWVYDDGRTNIQSWIEEAAKQAGR